MSIRAIVFLIVSAAFGLGAWWAHSEIERLEYLQAEGVVVTADVIDTDMRVKRSRDSTETNYYASIRFTAPGGQVVAEEVSITDYEYGQLAGATVDAPRKLDVVALHDGSDFMLADSIDFTLTMFHVLRVGFGLAAAVMLALAIRAQVRRRRRDMPTGAKPEQSGLDKQQQRLRKTYR